MRLFSVLLVVVALAANSVEATAQAPRNMIVNANFSQGFDPFRGGEVGKGWTGFVLSGTPSFRDTAALSPEFVERIDGPTSQTIWADGPGFEAGIYQTRGVTPGRQYKAWLTTSAKARGDATIARTIGVDPTGGVDPNSRAIVWAPAYSGERWATIEQGNAPMVVFAATGPRATIFVKVTVTGSGQNQAYLGSVWLVDDGVAPNQPAAPQQAPPPTTNQQPTPTPMPVTRPPGTAGRDDYAVENGWFYSQANGQNAGGNVGYVVSDADNVPFWTWFQRYGGVNAVGYPVSHRFMWDGFVSQAFQKVVFQFRPDQGGAVVFVNVFDQLSAAGRDDWLLTVRNVPKSQDWSSDRGRAWPDIVANHRRILDSYPAIRQVYDSAPDPVTQNGLPMGVQEFSNVIVVRAQRMVFQQWKIDVPWARANQVVVANGGDVAKEAGIFPAEAIAPQPWNFRPASLPVVRIQPAQPPAQPTNPPAAQPTPAPPSAGGLPYRGDGVSFLPNCGLTRVIVNVRDAQGRTVNGVRARIEWNGGDRPIDSNPTGRDGDGMTDFVLRVGTVSNTWRVWLVDGDTALSPKVEFTTNDDCRGPDARQIVTVNFRRAS